MTGITDEIGKRIRTYGYVPGDTGSTGLAYTTEYAQGVNRYEVLNPGSYTYSWANPTPPTRRVRTPSGSIEEVSFIYEPLAGVLPSRVDKFDATGTNLLSSVLYEHDSQGNLERYVDEDGGVTCYAYDQGRNLETARLEGLSGATACPQLAGVVPSGVQRQGIHGVAPVLEASGQRASPGRIVSWVYNGQPDPSAGGATASCAPASAEVLAGVPIAVLCKRIVQPTSDTDGRLGFAAQSDGDPQIWSATYDAHGRKLSEDGPRPGNADQVTFTYYDASSTCAGAGSAPGLDKGCRGELETVSNALGHVTRYLEYNAYGRPLAISEPNGLVTRVTYDARQRIVAITRGDQTTGYFRDDRGLVTRITQPDGSFVVYEYDDSERLVALSDAVGNSVRYTLDAAGNRTDQSVKDPSGTLERTAQMEYDVLFAPAAPDPRRCAMRQSIYIALALAFGTGNVAIAQQSGIEYNYEYDARGNLTRSSTAPAPRSRRVTMRSAVRAR